MKKFILVVGISFFFGIYNSMANENVNKFVEITKEDYYDKTLACILGQITGVLSGFEFTKTEIGSPYIGLPDEWFAMCKGPYGGGPKYGYAAGENCVIADGRIDQDDDYHVDIFNQLIFDQSESLPTSLDIQRLWKIHQVRDWGGGSKAMEIINKQDFIPPFTGNLEYGNIFSWCTEPYIENETVGCVAPGMLQTADMLTNRFAVTTGEYESVLFARFFGRMYAAAYFETNAVEAMRKAAAFLPEWSYAKFMYNKAVELYIKYPTDWRMAAKELTQYGRYIYRLDNVQVAYDINGGFTVLSILYGNNDYYNTIKIASLMGYDADCTAATAGGLLGIIKGMEGTDPIVKQVVYNYGDGVLVNRGKYVPFIALDYPQEQKFTDIALLYQKNAEKVITAMGGEIRDDKYSIPIEDVKQGCSVVIPNRDFEDDRIETKTEMNYAQGGVDKIQTFLPHSGSRTARIVTNRLESTGKVYLQTQNLEVGKVYKIGGFLVAKGKNQASLFVRNGSQFLTVSTFNNPNDWYQRSIVFKASDASADIGLYVPPTTGELFNAYLDDIMIEECRYNLLMQAEAETFIDSSTYCTEIFSEAVNASGNKYVNTSKGAKLQGITVNANEAGEHLMRIRFSNTSGEVVTARIMREGSPQAKLPFYLTGDKISFEENVVEAPVDLRKGENRLSIEQFSGTVSLDRIEIVSDSSSYIGESLWSPPLTSIKNLDKQDSPQIEIRVSPDKALIINQSKENLFSHASINNMLGECVGRLLLSGNKTVYPIADLTGGIYILSCYGKNRKESVKFIFN